MPHHLTRRSPREVISIGVDPGFGWPYKNLQFLELFLRKQNHKYRMKYRGPCKVGALTPQLCSCRGESAFLISILIGRKCEHNGKTFWIGFCLLLHGPALAGPLSVRGALTGGPVWAGGLEDLVLIGTHWGKSGGSVQCQPTRSTEMPSTKA